MLIISKDNKFRHIQKENVSIESVILLCEFGGKIDLSILVKDKPRVFERDYYSLISLENFLLYYVRF